MGADTYANRYPDGYNQRHADCNSHSYDHGYADRLWNAGAGDKRQYGFL
jgi:hypothetical protein